MFFFHKLQRREFNCFNYSLKTMYYKMYLAFSIYSFFAFTHFFYSTCTDDVIKWYIPSGALNVSNMLAAYEGTTFTNTIPPYVLKNPSY
jgi:hypothetical protein